MGKQSTQVDVPDVTKIICDSFALARQMLQRMRRLRDQQIETQLGMSCPMTRDE